MAQLVRPQEHDPSHEQYPRSSTTGLTHGEEHGPGDEEHEKKSVLKKVKAKAKKIKNKLQLHGGHGGHDHDEHGHREYETRGSPDDHDLDEEDDDEGDDDEMVVDPEVHGAPGYEGAAVRSYVVGEEERRDDPTRNVSDRTLPVRVDVGGTPAIKEVPSAPANTPASPSPGITEQRVRVQEVSRGNPGLVCEVPAGLEEDPHAPKDRGENRSPSNYETKESDPTGSGGGVAGSSPIVASFGKMTMEDEPEREPKEKSSTEPSSILPTGSHDQFSPDPTPPKQTNDQQDIPMTDAETSDVSGSASPGSYTGRISSATAAMVDKAVAAKNVISSKLGIGGKQESSTPETQEGQGGVPKTDSEHSDESGSASPGSYTGKISSATAAITDKAVSAKNVITSKLGIGEKHEPGSPKAQEAKAGTGYSPVEYGKKMAATVTDKLSPVYEKVAGAGTAVISKVQSPRGGPSDKGGASVKEYFSEKLKPGEEDKALSDMISETLFRKKTEGKEEAEGEGEERRPMGKVTESEEVKRHLGTSMEEDQGIRVDTSESSVRIPGINVVDKLKGAVGSWFGKGQESSTGSDQVVSSASASGEEGAGQRRPQESGN